MRHYAEKAQSYLLAAHDAIIAARVGQTYQANKRRRKEPAYQVGDKVWLSTEYLAMPKGRVRKLMPKFIGPYLQLSIGIAGRDEISPHPQPISCGSVEAVFGER